MNDEELLAMAVTAIYQTVLEPARWDAALIALSRLFQSPVAALWQYDFATQSAFDLKAIGIAPALPCQYMCPFCPLGPVVDVVRNAGLGQWLTYRPGLDCQTKANQSYMPDCARPANIGWVGGIKVASRPASLQFFGIQRPRRAGPFGDWGRRLGQLVAPHLMQALALQKRVEQLNAQQKLCQAVMDTLAACLVVLDANRCVGLANRAAALQFSGRSLLRLTGNRLQARSVKVDLQLNIAVCNACVVRPRATSFSIPGDEHNLPLQVMVLPLPHTHHLAGNLDRPQALLVAADPSAPYHSEDSLRSLFMLTAQEAKLLARLVDGDSMADFAREQHIKISTARSHMASLRCKLGVDTQAKVIALARILPATA